jgi:hypothetical protein
MILVAVVSMAVAIVLGAAATPRGPIVRVWATPFSTLVEVHGGPTAPPRNAELALVSRTHTRRDLAVGGDVEHLAETLKKLNGLKTSQREAAQSNRLLHVAVVDIPSANGLLKAPQIGVDLKNAGSAAVLLIAKDPIVWRAENATADQLGKIAVETPSSFDIEKATPGLVAGFRSDAFGDNGATGAEEYFSRDDAGRRLSFCRSLAYWAGFYGVPPSKIGIWTFTQPTEIKIRETGLSTTDWMQPRASDFEAKCQGRYVRSYSPSFSRNGFSLTGRSWR